MKSVLNSDGWRWADVSHKGIWQYWRMDVLLITFWALAGNQWPSSTHTFTSHVRKPKITGNLTWDRPKTQQTFVFWRALGDRKEKNDQKSLFIRRTAVLTHQYLSVFVITKAMLLFISSGLCCHDNISANNESFQVVCAQHHHPYSTDDDDNHKTSQVM